MTCPLEQPHPHGSTDHHSTGCRCDDTLAAHQFRLAKNRRQNRQRRMGLFTPDTAIDGTEVRAHIARLVKAGNRPERIAERAGLSLSGLNKIRNTRGKVRQSTADAILALHNDPAATVRAGDVPALASARRIQALAAIGHTAVSVARFTTVPEGTKDPEKYRRGRAALLKRIRAGDNIGTSPTIAADIARAYEALWNTEPDRSTKHAAGAATRAQKKAAAAGWLPPMYLDDDRLGDPSYKPRIPYLTRHNDPQELIPR